MVRKRIRTTDRAKNWDEKSMSAAINAIKDGKKLREVSKSYGIPLSTLRDRFKSGVSYKAQLGRKSTFTKKQEEEIAAYALFLAKTCYGLSSMELRRLVFEYAEMNNVKNGFNKSSGLAGKDWLCAFLKRNPGVGIRKPEAVSLNKIAASNPIEVSQLCSNFSSAMDKYHFNASRIFNYDETEISITQKSCKMSGPKGVKEVAAVIGWEREKTITIGCAMSASGSYIPPMFIYPRLRMNPALGNGGPVNSIYHCSKTGCITEDLFLKWLRHFIAFAKPTKDDPVLLIMDNHTTHKTLGTFKLCKENDIIVVMLPPHTSHCLQPLDVAFYTSLRVGFIRECDNFTKSNPHQKITPFDIASVFNKAYVTVANIENAISGFSSTGIHPFHPVKFLEADSLNFSIVENIRLPVVVEDGVSKPH